MQDQMAYRGTHLATAKGKDDSDPMGSTRTAPDSLPADRAADLVRQACRYIDAKAADGPVTLAQLGEICGLSPWHLQRLFKKILGISPRDYAESQRLKKLRQGLRQGDGVAFATYDAGLGSSSRLYERANKHLGMTPASYAKGGKGAAISYGLTQTKLGWLMAAATGKGVCFVALDHDPQILERQITAEFPAADSLIRDDAALGAVLTHLVRLLEGDLPRATLPLDIRATAFQRRVWQALSEIPAGETRTYAEIAAFLGHPQAQRAVGSACARNPVALLIPCHRAVRQDGGMGGYRWGTPRKQAILEQEKIKSETKQNF